SLSRGYELRVNGVPKTIDNDLPHTDHCPGYGSAIKYNGATVMEIAADVGCMATADGSCCLIEVMGRGAGWTAAGTVLANRAACGEAAVRAAVQGQTGFMVKLVRLQSAPYQWTTGLVPLPEIANAEHLIPRDWFTPDGFLPNEKFLEYARPLIEGEFRVPPEG